MTMYLRWMDSLQFSIERVTESRKILSTHIIYRWLKYHHHDHICLSYAIAGLLHEAWQVADSLVLMPSLQRIEFALLGEEAWKVLKGTSAYFDAWLTARKLGDTMRATHTLANTRTTTKCTAARVEGKTW